MAVLGPIALVLGLFGINVRDMYHWVVPRPEACPRHAPQRPSLSLENPALERRVRALLAQYESGWSRHDSSAMDRLFANDLCRYADTAPPERKSGALDLLDEQFTNQADEGYGRVRYRLLAPKEKPPGFTAATLSERQPVVQTGRREAVVYAQYSVVGPARRRPKREEKPLGEGGVRFHIVDDDGSLLIDEIKLG